MNFNILIENNLEISSVLDIGAHAGTFTFECKKYYPNAYYYMIDGNPITEDYIKHSGVDYKITYLSDIVKKTVVYKTKYNAFNTGDSLFRENTNYYNDENLITQDITTSTLDELFKNEKVFDFIKIDFNNFISPSMFNAFRSVFQKYPVGPTQHPLEEGNQEIADFIINYEKEKK